MNIKTIVCVCWELLFLNGSHAGCLELGRLSLVGGDGKFFYELFGQTVARDQKKNCFV